MSLETELAEHAETIKVLNRLNAALLAENAALRAANARLEARLTALHEQPPAHIPDNGMRRRKTDFHPGTRF